MISWIIPVLAAAACGAALGAEREFARKVSGIRTNTLIALGSAIFTIMSINLSPSVDDKTRIAAQIVTGIGFLGAGTILRHDKQSFITGLTSAATIWVVAAIGMVAGSGHFFIAILATIVTLLILTGMRRLENLIHATAHLHEIKVDLDPSHPGREELITKILLRADADMIFIGPPKDVDPAKELRVIYVARESAHRDLLNQIGRASGVLEIKELSSPADIKA